MPRGVAAAVLALVALAAPASAMTLYTSQVLPDVQALVNAFRKEHPGAEVKIVRTGSGEIEAKLRGEFEARNPQADAVWIADPSFYEYLAAHRMLRSRPAEVRLLFDVIAVNTRRLGSLPRPADWGDLLKPAYRGLVAMPDPNYSGAALVMLGALTKRYGFGFFEKLKANGMRIERSNPLLLQRLVQGDCAIALMIDFDVRQSIVAGAPLAVVYPHDGAILVRSPIAVLANAKDAATAEAFVHFLQTSPAQALFAQRNYVPVHGTFPGAPAAPKATLPSAPREILADKDDLLRRFNALFDLGA